MKAIPYQFLPAVTHQITVPGIDVYDLFARKARESNSIGAALEPGIPFVALRPFGKRTIPVTGQSRPQGRCCGTFKTADFASWHLILQCSIPSQSESYLSDLRVARLVHEETYSVSHTENAVMLVREISEHNHDRRSLSVLQLAKDIHVDAARHTKVGEKQIRVFVSCTPSIHTGNIGHRSPQTSS